MKACEMNKYICISQTFILKCPKDEFIEIILMEFRRCFPFPTNEKTDPAAVDHVSIRVQDSSIF